MGESESATWEFYRHMPVYLSNGKRLGYAVEIGHAVDYIHVRQGRILTYDWYLPISVVRDVTGDGVFLDVDSAALRHNHWNVPAEEFLNRQGATPGYEYTSAADIPSYGDRDAVADAQRG
ncbi:MAG TPA: hypothetical protein VFB58_12235 [Chloroflexota bacterium]|nr:hypothetical protein [Chloroflexota bacterium]